MGSPRPTPCSFLNLIVAYNKRRNVILESHLMVHPSEATEAAPWTLEPSHNDTEAQGKTIDGTSHNIIPTPTGVPWREPSKQVQSHTPRQSFRLLLSGAIQGEEVDSLEVRAPGWRHAFQTEEPDRLCIGQRGHVVERHSHGTYCSFSRHGVKNQEPS